ncbi:protein of unknown function [Nitrospira japonica]|uniref:Uncharacterized protein n=1 Tax=Nitrospira japonica TaxID=1325564 RepID=A0A1W1I896_9BACT|nr:hypothetical protein [Nitrospira japonica]SLM49224.1 protein of unknown function [Nitrospira japonica]
MPNLQVVEPSVEQAVEQAVKKGRMSEEPSRSPSGTTGAIGTVIRWTVGIVVAFALGSWLVWLTAYLQRHFVLEDIRSSCQRIMPDAVERCVDTVIIQRGGARR